MSASAVLSITSLDMIEDLFAASTSRVLITGDRDRSLEVETPLRNRHFVPSLLAVGDDIADELVTVPK